MIFTITITTIEGNHLKIEGDSKKYYDQIINEYWDTAQKITSTCYNDIIEYIK